MTKEQNKKKSAFQKLEALIGPLTIAKLPLSKTKCFPGV